MTQTRPKKLIWPAWKTVQSQHLTNTKSLCNTSVSAALLSVTHVFISFAFIHISSLCDSWIINKWPLQLWPCWNFLDAPKVQLCNSSLRQHFVKRRTYGHHHYFRRICCNMLDVGVLRSDSHPAPPSSLFPRLCGQIWCSLQPGCGRCHTVVVYAVAFFCAINIHHTPSWTMD